MAGFDVPAGYRVLDERALPGALEGLPEVRDRLGGSPGRWQVGQVSEGDINAVFTVTGRGGAVIGKQALPMIRATGSAGPGLSTRPREPIVALTRIGRILGISHAEDLGVIADPGRRAVCETRALRVARELLVNGGRHGTVAEVTALARDAAGA